MLAQGFVDEVIHLRQRYQLTADLPSMRAVGYRQVWSYLEREIDRDTLLEKAVSATRQLAKRQLTWLRKWPELELIALQESKKAGKFEPLGNTLDKFAGAMKELGM